MYCKYLTYIQWYIKIYKRVWTTVMYNHKYALYRSPSGFGLTSCYHLLLQEYHYVNVKMSWADAQHYCREKYTDLATIVSTDDIRRLDRPNTDSSIAWIGLSDHPKSWKGVMGNDANSWRWSVTGNTSTTGYHNLGSTLINNADGNQVCVLVEKTGQWNDFSCLSERRFVCYTGKTRFAWFRSVINCCHLE